MKNTLKNNIFTLLLPPLQKNYINTLTPNAIAASPATIRPNPIMKFDPIADKPELIKANPIIIAIIISISLSVIFFPPILFFLPCQPKKLVGVVCLSHDVDDNRYNNKGYEDNHYKCT